MRETAAVTPHESRIRPRVTVIVLSYDRPRLLERALVSIRAQTYSPLDILVVDNRSASSDQVRVIVERFAAVRLIANDGNPGFTGGMNRGLAEATGDYVYLTEDDIELDPHCLEALVGHLEPRPAVGLAGPIMFNRRAGTIRCAGGRFELGAVYRMVIFGASEQDQGAFNEPFSATYLPGSMMCGRASLWRQLRGFRDDFFMYVEDVELCARVLEAGFSIDVVPAAKVFHDEPPDEAGPGRLAFHKQKNLAALYILHASVFVLPSFILRYGIIGFLRLAIGDRAQVPAFLKAWWWVLCNAPRLLGARRRRVAGPRPTAVPVPAELAAPGNPVPH